MYLAFELSTPGQNMNRKLEQNYVKTKQTNARGRKRNTRNQQHVSRIISQQWVSNHKSKHQFPGKEATKIVQNQCPQPESKRWIMLSVTLCCVIKKYIHDIPERNTSI